MAELGKSLDIWIVESNTVYKQVPFTVAADWVQQGRLLEDDKVRSTGKGDWYTIAETPALLSYVPRPEPQEVNDRAEALEPVEIEPGWRRRRIEEEDDEVDMIPLIDVSLVLLIFFIMGAGTSTSGGMLPPINTPHAFNGVPFKNAREIRIDIDLKKDGTGRNAQPLAPQVPVYSIYLDGKQVKNGNDPLYIEGLDSLMAELKPAFDAKKGTGKTLNIIYNADEKLEDGFIVDFLAELRKRYHREINTINIGVRGK